MEPKIQTVSFFSEGYRIDGELYLPADLKPGEKLPACALVTGYMGTRDLYLPGMASEICKSGRYVCLIFDFKGWGTSEPAPYPNRLAPFGRVLDAQAAATYLSLHVNVDPKKVTLWGISFGGITSLFLQAIDKTRIKCVAVVASGVAPPPGSPEAKAAFAALSEDEKKQRAAQALDLRKVIEDDRRNSVMTGKSELIARSRIMQMDAKSLERSEKQRNSLASGPSVTHVPASFLPETAQFTPDLLRAIAPLTRNIIFVTSEADKVLPPSHAKQLYDRVGGAKKMVVIPASMEMDHFGLYEAQNVRHIARNEVLPAFAKWFAESDKKTAKM